MAPRTSNETSHRQSREKATVALDRAKVAEAQRLTGTPNTSATVDHALAELIRAERLRRDLAACGASGVSDAEIALAQTPVDDSDLADATGWASLHPPEG